MATVEVTFTALPAHVRTARLVALAVARRVGVADDLLDEVRLAVGEACSRAVGVNQGKSADVPVRMRLSDEQDRFIVDVVDVGPLVYGAAGTDLDLELLSVPAETEGPEPLYDLRPTGCV